MDFLYNFARNHPKTFKTIFGLLSVGLLASFGLNIWIRWEPRPVYKVDFIESGPFGRPLLILRGEISEPMYADSRKYVSADALPSDLALDVSINSTGGNGDYSTRLVELLSQRHSVVWLDPDTACISACVQLFASLPSYASPSAVLGFHQGRIQNSNRVKFMRTLGVGPENETNSTIMRPWIARISPKLLAFIDSCKKNPLETDDGIGLRWDEIEQIIEGKNSFTCDEKQSQPLSDHFKKVFRIVEDPSYLDKLLHLF